MAAAIDAAVETHTVPPPQETISNSNEELIIRKAGIWEAAEIGRIAADTYYDTKLTEFLSPKRDQYPTDYKRAFIQRSQKRLLEPRNASFVVVTKSNPKVPIGYACFVRLGDDEGAKRQIESHGLLKRMMLRVLLWMYTYWCMLLNWWVGGDKSEDKEHLAMFMEWVKEGGEKHWNSHPDRKNRWHAQSVAIRKEFQRRKAGKKLMMEVVKKAEEENVVVGLESSKLGEMMYRSVGFELVARFANAERGHDFEDGNGGVMMYTPLKRR